MTDEATFAFDCFLSHNSKDKPAVKALAGKLVAAGLKVWLDDEQMTPGRSALDLMDAGVRASRTVAVLIGADGQGPWQQQEVKAALHQMVRDNRTVIPVLLPRSPDEPDLPVFLRDLIRVDMRPTSASDQAEALRRLVWGITGKPPVADADDDAPRLERLLDTLWDVEDRLSPEDFDALTGRLNRLKRRGVGAADEALLEELERFLAGELDVDAFLGAWRGPAPQQSFDFDTAAADWRDGRIALFLGQDLPKIYGGDIPPTRELAKCLKAFLQQELKQPFEDFGDTLAEVAELFELGARSSRADVRRAMSRLLAGNAGDIGLYDLIAEAPSPMLVLTSAYHMALEARLRCEPERRFLLASPSVPSTDAVAMQLELEYWPTAQTPAGPVDPERLSEAHPLASGLTLIYRLRGRILDETRDSLLISEGDYARAVQQAKRLLPDYIAAEVSARQLWFIGYDPRRWEDRLLVRLLLQRRERSAPKAIVIGPGKDALARAFWAGNGVDCVDDLDVPAFVAKLAGALR